MIDDKKIDYGNVPITKLPPGKAYGADDLQRWAQRRNTGSFGTGIDKAKSVLLKCKACGKTRDMLTQIYVKARSLHPVCECGKRMRPVIFKREGFRRPGSSKTVVLEGKGKKR